MPRNISLEQSLAMERDPLVPDSELPHNSARIRRAMLRTRAPFTLSSMAAQVMPDHPEGAAKSLVQQTMAVMRRLGFTFDKTPPTERHGEATYLLTNPDHVPTAEQLQATRVQSHPHSRAKAKADEERRAADRERKRAEREAKRAAGAVERVNGAPPADRAVIERLPRLTDVLTVTATALADDGSLMMMLRAADGTSFTVGVEGASF